MRISCEVLRVSRKVSKAGNEFNLVTLGFPGFEKGSFFLPEHLVPDMIEGVSGTVQFELKFKDWKPDLRIVGFVSQS